MVMDALLLLRQGIRFCFPRKLPDDDGCGGGDDDDGMRKLMWRS